MCRRAIRHNVRSSGVYLDFDSLIGSLPAVSIVAANEFNLRIIEPDSLHRKGKTQRTRLIIALSQIHGRPTGRHIVSSPMGDGCFDGRIAWQLF